jgi:hypothetical protein
MAASSVKPLTSITLSNKAVVSRHFLEIIASFVPFLWGLPVGLPFGTRKSGERLGPRGCELPQGAAKRAGLKARGKKV